MGQLSSRCNMLKGLGKVSLICISNTRKYFLSFRSKG
jgi:hypothetical protein